MKEPIFRDAVGRLENSIRRMQANDSSGHDWWHTWRVRNLATYIASKENADLLVVELAALLHDVSDWKFNIDEKAGFDNVKGLLVVNKLEKYTRPVISCIRNISFKGAGVPDKSGSIEAQCVQDADRLDAIGAIGIARTFAFGGHHNRTLFDPETKPVMVTSFEQYKSQNSPTINHFYEKLFLLRDRLNTNTAKRIAANRHQYLEDFIKQFMDEWNGSDFIRESDH